MNNVFIIEKNEDIRLDVYLTNELDLTRSRIKQLIEDGSITVNKLAVKCGKSLKEGDIIEVNISEPTLLTVEPQDIPLDIIFEDDDIAVINKQQGLVVHPANNNYKDTLVNALMFHLNSLSGINGVIRPGIVHRLDKDTSGVIVVAKNDAAHLSLSTQMANRQTKKIYRAIVEGKVVKDSGTIETNIGRNPKDRKQMAVVRVGRTAITKYNVLHRYNEFTYMEFQLLTGRTHQIRVHSKFIGHPIVGDLTYGYGKQRFKLNGQLLHSYQLTIIHPTSKEQMTFTAPLPKYFNEVLERLN